MTDPENIEDLKHVRWYKMTTFYPDGTKREKIFDRSEDPDWHCSIMAALTGVGAVPNTLVRIEVASQRDQDVCRRCRTPLLGNTTQAEDKEWPLFKCIICGTINFWD